MSPDNLAAYFNALGITNPWSVDKAGTQIQTPVWNWSGDAGGSPFNTTTLTEDVYSVGGDLMDKAPDLYRNLSNNKNFQVLGQNEDGSWKVKQKIGDKEAMVFNIGKDANGQWTQWNDGKVGWDTNTLKNAWGIAAVPAFGLAAGTVAGALGLSGAPTSGLGGLLGGSEAAAGGAADLGANVGAGSVVPNSAVAQSFPVAQYGASLTAPLNPATISATGLATGAAGLAGPYVTGDIAGSSALAQKAFDAAKTAGSGLGTKTGGTSIAKGLADMLGISPTAAQLLGGLLGAGLGYADAKSQEGKTQGGAPAVSAVGMQYLNNMKPYERNTQYATQLQGLLGPRQQQANPQLQQAQQYVSGLLGAGYQPFRFY